MGRSQSDVFTSPCNCRRNPRVGVPRRHRSSFSITAVLPSPPHLLGQPPVRRLSQELPSWSLASPSLTRPARRAFLGAGHVSALSRGPPWLRAESSLLSGAARPSQPWSWPSAPVAPATRASVSFAPRVLAAGSASLGTCAFDFCAPSAHGPLAPPRPLRLSLCRDAHPSALAHRSVSPATLGVARLAVPYCASACVQQVVCTSQCTGGEF